MLCIHHQSLWGSHMKADFCLILMNASVALLSELVGPLCSSTVSSHCDFQAISCPLCWPTWFLSGCPVIWSGVIVPLSKERALLSLHTFALWVFVCAYSLLVHSFFLKSFFVESNICLCRVCKWPVLGCARVCVCGVFWTPSLTEKADGPRWTNRHS